MKQTQDQGDNLGEQLEEQKLIVEEKDKTIEVLQLKLEECSQTLQSNKQMIEYLSKTVNEAQKATFRTLVTNKSKERIPNEGPSGFISSPTSNKRLNFENASQAVHIQGTEESKGFIRFQDQ